MEALSPLLVRRRGRPRRTAASDARAALLDAAVMLFAERGVAATTAAEIAARAGVTPAMVHYYFRSRERLLDAVVDERLSRFVAHVFGAMPALSAPAVTLIVAIVDGMFDAVKRMPWMPPIWMREIASDGGLLRERMLTHLPVAAIAGLTERLSVGKRRSEVAAAIEPRFAFLSIVGLTMLPLATRSLWPKLTVGAVPLSTANLHRHAVAVLTGGLAHPLVRPRRSR